MDQVQTLVDREQYGEAAELLTELAGGLEGEERSGAATHLAHLHLLAGNCKEALAQFNAIAINGNFAFERAYALYRLGRFPEALSTLTSAPLSAATLPYRHQILLAQVLYRLGRYPESVQVYESLITAKGREHPDRLLVVNFLAAKAAAGQPLTTAVHLGGDESTDPEVLYNVACAHYSAGGLDAAQEIAIDAERRTTDPELRLSVQLLLAVCAFQQGNADHASALLAQIREGPEVVVRLARRNLHAMRNEPVRGGTDEGDLEALLGANRLAGFQKKLALLAVAKSLLARGYPVKAARICRRMHRSGQLPDCGVALMRVALKDSNSSHELGRLLATDSRFAGKSGDGRGEGLSAGAGTGPPAGTPPSIRYSPPVMSRELGGIWRDRKRTAQYFRLAREYSSAAGGEGDIEVMRRLVVPEIVCGLVQSGDFGQAKQGLEAYRRLAGGRLPDESDRLLLEIVDILATAPPTGGGAVDGSPVCQRPAFKKEIQKS